MPSPITVAVTPTLIVTSNRRRNMLFLQNVGTFPIYLLKVSPNAQFIPTPSITNYDYVLSAGTAANDGKGGVLRIDTIAGFVGIAIGGTSSIAAMSTVNV